MFELKNKRLIKIAEMVKPCRCVADIGTDHAHLPIELVLSGKCRGAIACDVKKGPLEVAKKNISELALEGKIELRLGFGLQVVEPCECECITVAGMGGLMICDILERSEEVAGGARQLVLQPNTCEYDLREYLFENGYVIDDERGVHDGEHYYLIISCRKHEKTDGGDDKGGCEVPDDNYYFMGNIMPERMSPEDRAFLSNLKKKTERVLEGIALSGENLTEENAEKKAKYEALTEKLCIILERGRLL